MSRYHRPSTFPSSLPPLKNSPLEVPTNEPSIFTLEKGRTNIFERGHPCFHETTDFPSNGDITSWGFPKYQNSVVPGYSIYRAKPNR